VIIVGVGDHHAIEPSDAKACKLRNQDALGCRGGSHRGTGIDQQGVVSGLNQDGTALPHIKEMCPHAALRNGACGGPP
jgi:hypothetical protein